MPSLDEHPSLAAVKILVAADSGAGKTGGLASLVDAGHTLRILDFDNGVSTLRGYIKNKDNLKNVKYIPLYDKLKLAGKVIGVAKASAFQEAMNVLTTGRLLDGSEAWGDSPGPLTDWPATDILCVDAFSTMGRSALAMVMQLDGKGMQQPEIQHYGIAMDNLEKFIGIITSDAVRCNVIVNTHLQPIEGQPKIYPEALGSKLAPKIGRYFDNMITISTTGGKKEYKTQRDGLFTCKTAIPMDPTYPLESGMEKIFSKLLAG